MKIAKGAWPVNLTALNEDGSLDFKGNQDMTNWYIKNGAAGLFTVCTSGEMFYLNEDQRLDLAKCVVEAAAGRVPVIASGSVSMEVNKEIDEIGRMAETGIDAVVLLTNGLAGLEDGFDVFKKNLDAILAAHPNVRFAAYECPTPYKRLLTDEEIKYLASTERIEFLKDVSVSVETYERRAKLVKGTNLMLFNATPGTMLKAFQLGYDGYCGPMANYHPDLCQWMYENFAKEPEKAAKLQAWETMIYTAAIGAYPMNAKEKMAKEGCECIPFSYYRDMAVYTPIEKDFVNFISEQENMMRKYLGIIAK